MPSIVITNEAMQALHSACLPSHDWDISKCRRLPGGRWLVPVPGETLDRLDSARLPDETTSDLLIRLVRHMKGAKLS